MPDATDSLSVSRPSFTIKSLLVPLLTRPRVAQFIKWTVYLALIINFGVYAYDDWMAFESSLASDAPWSDVLEKFSTTIDMIAWLGLVFLFELETYALPDEAFKVWVTQTIHVLRIICYVGIVYAAYGYTINTLDNYNVAELDGLADLCQIADRDTALQLDTITYARITPGNCTNISVGPPFYRIADDVSVIDGPTLDHVQKLGWVDVANAYVWLIVVFLIEIEVRMQAAERFGSRALRPVRQLKTVFYGVLMINIVIWGATSYPLYAWDAFLWIFGFWAIELNLAEWEQEHAQQLAAAVR
jgi:hypothetical protein